MIRLESVDKFCSSTHTRSHARQTVFLPGRSSDSQATSRTASPLRRSDPVSINHRVHNNSNNNNNNTVKYAMQQCKLTINVSGPSLDVLMLIRSQTVLDACEYVSLRVCFVPVNLSWWLSLSLSLSFLVFLNVDGREDFSLLASIFVSRFRLSVRT